jgi:cob(I)alamin adenosyltransferase
MAQADLRGLTQVYTGDGKGKTTAALGQAMRASGQGMRVIVIQFLKGQTCGEHSFVQKCKAFDILQFGEGDLFKKEEAELSKETGRACQVVEDSLTGGKYDMVILDEVFIAHRRGFLSQEMILSWMDRKPADVELVMTGRDAPPAVIKRADLVTEMLMIKHPYLNGVPQRQGIEF